MATQALLILLPLGLASGLLSGCVAGRSGAAERPAPESTTGTTVTAADIERSPRQSIEAQLMARTPGVVITRTAEGGLAVRIRGTTTLHGNTEPLYIVDGVPIQPGPGGGLTGINAYDIATIDVLKDPASTSQYGVRGANGVIIIRTKRGRQ